MYRGLHTAIKMTLVALIAGLISLWLNLGYWLTGSVLALLSIQSTKKDSLMIGFKRIIDALYALLLATLFFVLFGYHFLVFVVIVFIFSFTSWLFKIVEGVVPALVIVTHLLIFGQFSWLFLLEETLLVILSIGIAVVFNTFYPVPVEKGLQKDIHLIDQSLQNHLMSLADLIKEPKQFEANNIEMTKFDDQLKEMFVSIELAIKDRLFQRDTSVLAYMYLRNTQSNFLKSIFHHASTIHTYHPHAEEIADLMMVIANDVGLYQESEKNLSIINALLTRYRQSDLPQSREEFETRATLYQILIELEAFVMLKHQFHERNPHF
ncbi:MAG: aromatic acid exporter family protein [Acholeplasmataceae bacterium]|nr:aromatic acid exporter family protein [Acholeplasmataceae bacterium]